MPDALSSSAAQHLLDYAPGYSRAWRRDNTVYAPDELLDVSAGIHQIDAGNPSRERTALRLQLSKVVWPAASERIVVCSLGLIVIA